MEEAYRTELVLVFDGPDGPAEFAGPAPEPAPPLAPVTLAALGALVALAAADGVEVRLEHPATRGRSWPPTWSLPSAWLWTAGGSGTGITGFHGESDAEQAFRAVDAAQVAIVESMPSLGRPTNWPQCPHHPDTHPLRVVVGTEGDPRPRWACPRTSVVGVGVPLGSIME